MDDTTNHTPNVWRSIGAVFAGIVFVIITHLVMDVLMHATGVFPPWGQPMSDALFLWVLIYRTGFSVAGAYVTARLAPHHPLQHALAGAAIGLLVSIAGTVATWNRGPEFGPHWYPLALIALTLPCAWLGGKLGERSWRAN